MKLIYEPVWTASNKENQTKITTESTVKQCQHIILHKNTVNYFVKVIIFAENRVMKSDNIFQLANFIIFWDYIPFKNKPTSWPWHNKIWLIVSKGLRFRVYDF